MLGSAIADLVNGGRSVVARRAPYVTRAPRVVPIPGQVPRCVNYDVNLNGDEGSEADPSLRNTHRHFAKSPPHHAPSVVGIKRSSRIVDAGDYTLITLLRRHGCRSQGTTCGKDEATFVRRASGVEGV
jgi:hypothetical protein